MSDHSELKRRAEEILEIERVHPCGSARVILVNPATVLELIAEVEALSTQVRLAGVSAEFTVHQQVGRAVTEVASVSIERDQLKSENEALRKDAERYRWLRDSSESIHQFYLSTPIWFTGVKFSKENVDSTIDAAMGKGDS